MATSITSMSHNDKWLVYESVVALAWADGRLSAEEVQAARAVAEELGLSGPFSMAGAVLRHGNVKLPKVSPSLAIPVYASATWIAHVDGSVHRRERIALDRLRARLGLDENATKRLDGRARLLASMPDRKAYRRLLRRSMRETAAREASPRAKKPAD